PTPNRRRHDEDPGRDSGSRRACPCALRLRGDLGRAASGSGRPRHRARRAVRQALEPAAAEVPPGSERDRALHARCEACDERGRLPLHQPDAAAHAIRHDSRRAGAGRLRRAIRVDGGAARTAPLIGFDQSVSHARLIHDPAASADCSQLPSQPTRVRHVRIGSLEEAVSSTPYELGHEADELERLNVQGRALAATSRVLLEAAGLRDGMRVLDLGSGAGDMSFVLADVIGGAGGGVGIERAPEAVAEATARAERLGRANVRFVLGDIHDPLDQGAFDAVVGRLVLMFVPEPSAVLRTQAAAVRPGGIVAPIEYELTRARTIPETPLAAQALSWVRAAFEGGGNDVALGPRLRHGLDHAGPMPSGLLSIQPP